MPHTDTLSAASDLAALDHVIETVIRPNAARNDIEARYPRDNIQALAETGWAGPFIPREHGGLGAGYAAFSEAAARISRADASTGLVYTMHGGAQKVISLIGNDEQKARIFPRIREGLILTYAISERATGGHFWHSLSSAERDGEDYHLNLTKSFSTGGGFADYHVLQTRSPDTDQPDNLTYFFIDRRSEGISIGEWNALGVRANN